MRAFRRRCRRRRIRSKAPTKAKLNRRRTGSPLRSPTITARTETEALSASVESRFTQTAADMMAIFDAAYDYTGGDRLQQFCDAFRTFIRFSSDGVEIGSPTALSRRSSQTTGWRSCSRAARRRTTTRWRISDKKLYITEAQVLKTITFGADEHGRLFDLKADEHGLTLTCRPVAVDTAQGGGTNGKKRFFTVTTSNRYISGKVEWEESSVSEANNTSKVTATLYLKRTNTGYTTWGQGSFTITINGNAKSGGTKYLSSPSTATSTCVSPHGDGDAQQQRREIRDH